MTPSKKAAKSDILPLIRGMVRAYQAFHNYDSKQLAIYNVTVVQADIIFTLGNTDGLTYKQIGQKTLTSKGTLTGVIDRLLAKKLVKKCINNEDARSQIVTLTAKGDKLFQEVFPNHIKSLENALSNLSKKTKDSLINDLMLLEKEFNNNL